MSLGKEFKDKQARAAALLADHDPMTLAMALLKAVEGESFGLDNGCGNNVEVEHLLSGNIDSAVKALNGQDNYQTFTRALDADKQEKVLSAMLQTGTVAIHVEQLKATFSLDDVYDNSGEAKSNFGIQGVEPDTSKLTILFCAPDGE